MSTILCPFPRIPSLSAACLQRNLDEVNYWLQIDPLESELRDALHIAATLGDAPILALLLHSGAPVNSETAEGVTALDLAWAADDGVAAVRVLHAYGANSGLRLVVPA